MSSNMKNLRFQKPTQLLIQGQWWSIRRTHFLQMRQWWVRASLMRSHLKQYPTLFKDLISSLHHAMLTDWSRLSSWQQLAIASSSHFLFEFCPWFPRSRRYSACSAWEGAYDVVWGIARRAIDWFVVADAKYGDVGDEDRDEEDKDCEVLSEGGFTYS